MPFPLGRVLPGAAFATASAPLTQNITPVEQDGVTPRRRFNLIEIRAFINNSGPNGIYICSNANPPDEVNYLNVVDVLQAGEAFPRGTGMITVEDIGNLFIGADNATDFAIVNVFDI